MTQVTMPRLATHSKCYLHVELHMYLTELTEIKFNVLIPRNAFLIMKLIKLNVFNESNLILFSLLYKTSSTYPNNYFNVNK